MDVSTRPFELGRIVAAVREGQAVSRSELSAQLGIRSTTVSDLVGELVQNGVLLETRQPSSGRGRPVIRLSYNAHRFVAILVSVVDRTFVARLVDSGFRQLAECRASPPSTATNAEIARCLRDRATVLARAVPRGSTLSALVFSLSGLLDIDGMTWCYTSRWPALANLELGALGEAVGCRIHLIRNLDAEVIGYRSAHGIPAAEATLLLHWGHGIGASFHCDGAPIHRYRGRFCEIGHWTLAAREGRICTCGNTDCLETVAALWALGPKLQHHFADLPLEETQLAERGRRLDLLDVSAMREALDQVLRVTTNLCRLMFPDRVVLSGPFVNNPVIFSRFVEELSRAPLLKTFDSIQVSVIESSIRLETEGALAEPMQASLNATLQNGV